jgi:hypothetical protein
MTDEAPGATATIEHDAPEATPVNGTSSSPEASSPPHTPENNGAAQTNSEQDYVKKLLDKKLQRAEEKAYIYGGETGKGVKPLTDELKTAFSQIGDDYLELMVARGDHPDIKDEVVKSLAFYDEAKNFRGALDTKRGVWTLNEMLKRGGLEDDLRARILDTKEQFLESLKGRSRGLIGKVLSRFLPQNSREREIYENQFDENKTDPEELLANSWGNRIIEMAEKAAGRESKPHEQQTPEMKSVLTFANELMAQSDPTAIEAMVQRLQSLPIPEEQKAHVAWLSELAQKETDSGKVKGFLLAIGLLMLLFTSERR